LKRVFHPYDVWEDYLNGMYEERKDEEKATRIQKSADLLRDNDKLYKAMKYVSNHWKHASEVNLSNRAGNRQAWLGQAACNYALNATESEVRQAWRMLDQEEMNKANVIADKVAKEWEENYILACYN
jgi:hypothetical protein